MSDDVVAECVGVRRSYSAGGGIATVLDGVHMRVRRGRFLAMMGPSGSGKSTLLRLLGCLDRADAGKVTVDGKDTTAMSRRGRRKLRRFQVSYVRQNPADNLIEYLTVGQHLGMTAKLRHVADGRKQAERLLTDLGLTEHFDRLPRHLSGGEQQRVSLACAALGDPTLLIADEPTGQLDHTVGAMVLDALHMLAERGLAVVVATHDPTVVERAEDVVRLRDGRVVDSPDALRWGDEWVGTGR